MNNLLFKKLWLVPLILVLTIAGQAQANVVSNPTLLFTDFEYVGYVNPGRPADPEEEVEYINYLSDRPANSPDYYDAGTDQTYNREGSTIVVTEDAEIANNYRHEVPTDDDPYVFSVSDTYNFIMAKYDAQNAGSVVWYFNMGVTGQITVPEEFMGHRVSHISLYNYTEGGGGGGSGGAVPEPASLALMGLGSLLAGVGLRRRQKKLAD